jgi:Flp pilus assembly protein TadG
VRWRQQDGVLAVETAIIAPAVLVLLLLVVYAARVVAADAQVQTAAARAARAASLEADASAATAAADELVAANLTGTGISCRTTRSDVDVARFGPGATVTVTAACEISNRDLAMLAVPGTRWSVAEATHVVDTYRGGVP